MSPRSTSSAALTLCALLATLTLPAAAAGDVLAPTSLVSGTPAGQAGNNLSQWSAISHDGRHVVFTSLANDLVPGDTNSNLDVFLRDTLAGTTELISVSTTGGPSDGPSIQPSVSGDGRYVCFTSGTTNLVSPPASGLFSIFVRDRVSGTTELASVSAAGVQANNTTEFSAISADGRRVAFGSYADNLVLGHPLTGFRDVYLRDMLANTTILVSKGPGGALADSSSSEVAISGDGGLVAFRSQADNLVTGGTTPGRQHIYLYDFQTSVLSLVSSDAGGAEGNGDSFAPALSADGRYLAFETYATNLLPNTTGSTVVVVRDLTSNTLLDVNLDSLGLPITVATRQASLSADGRFVSFGSGVVLPNQSGARFVRDRQLGKTLAVCSMDDGSNPVVGAHAAWISGDGSTLAFETTHSLVLGVNNGNDVFVRGLGSPLTYCQGKFHSAGCTPSIGFTGQARVSNGYALTVTGSNALSRTNGILMHGLTGPQQKPFAGGSLCLAKPFARSIVTQSGGNPPPKDCSGVWSLDLGTVLANSSVGPAVSAGSILTMQWWGRDSGFPAPNNAQLSNALQVVVGP